MSEYSLELGEKVKNLVCECCGAPVKRVWGFVSKDGAAHAVYYALLAEHPPERWVGLTISVGNWWEEGARNKRQWVHIYAKNEARDPPIWLSVLLGAGIGFLSGLTGTGGGIFLSPLIIFLGWSDLRTASGIAAVFIFGNSIAGLLGNLAIVRSLPAELPIYIVAVMLGALVGTTFGTKFSVLYIRRALGLVLVIAGLKLIGVY